MNKTVRYITIAILSAVGSTASVLAHCQVPCGIYNDEMRIQMMQEHVTTIEKAMKQIEAGQNANQTARWVLNKEKHAEELSEIVTYYFLAQRIKPDMDHYEENLKTFHGILVYTMKSKQTTDLAHVAKLKELIHHLEHSYFGKEHNH
ncbi:MAG: superoxide dismutase [Ni] [Pontiella sp.]